MLPPVHVPTDTFSLVVTAVQCANLGAVFNEMKSPAPYSKFAEKLESTGATWPSRKGMLVIYSPALLTSAACLATAPSLNGRETLVSSLLVAHFAKRVLETLALHKYSGRCSAPMAGFIGIFYALGALLIASQQRAVPASVYAASNAALPLGLALFAVGQAGNLYHHYLLAALRRPVESSASATGKVPPTPSTSQAMKEASLPAVTPRYVLPTGGLFDLVTMPHYLFEIVAWLGIAMCAQQLNALLVAAGMASYLSGRAIATTRWYTKRFGDKWPKARRHLVPFLF